MALIMENMTDVDTLARVNSDYPSRVTAEIHPCVIYRFLREKSPEACLDLLPLLSTEQFVRLFDYDVWEQDRLAVESAVRWLNLYRCIDDKEVVARFRSLDEEYQLAIMGSLLKVVEQEEFDKLDLHEQDNFIPLPCRQLYYRIQSEQAEVLEFVQAFIDISLAQDMAWTYSLLTHATYCLVNEQELLAAQFRTARLEEDGFVSFAESNKIFLPLKPEPYLAKWWGEKITTPTATFAGDFFGQVIKYARDKELFTTEIRDQVQLKLLFCTNTLCSATMIEVSDQRGVKQILRQTQAIIGLSLDYLARGNLPIATEILVAEHGWTLFRIGMTLIYRVQEKLLEVMRKRGLPKIKNFSNLYHLRKWATLPDFMDINWIDLLDYEQLEALKEIFARFPELTISSGKEARLESISSMYYYRIMLDRAAAIAGELT